MALFSSLKEKALFSSLKEKKEEVNPWQTVLSKYEITNPYAVEVRDVQYQKPVEYEIKTITTGGTRNPLFKNRPVTPKVTRTGYYGGDGEFVDLTPEQLKELGGKKTITTYEPYLKQVLVDTVTGKQTDAPKMKLFGGSRELYSDGDISYRLKFENGKPQYYTVKKDDDSFLGGAVKTFAPAAILLAPGLGSVLASTLGTSAAVGSALAGGLIGGTFSEATGGDFLEGALKGGLGSAASGIVSPAISEAAGGGMLGSAIGQGATSAGLAALQGGNTEQAALLGAFSGAANYTPPAQGMNSPLTPAQIESGLGTEGYGVGAQAQSSGLFDPAVIGSGAYTQTSYPIDMAELAAADAMQLMNQGVGIPAVEQNLVASGLDPLIAADLTQQISLDPNLTSNDLANKLISTYGSNIYDTTIDQINEAAPKSTEPVSQVTSADINWGALAKGLVGLLGAGAASQMASQPAVQQQARPAYKPVDNMPTYSPEYFQQIQQYYNTYLPSTPRDVATPLQDWYSSGYEQPDSVTAKLFSGG